MSLAKGWANTSLNEIVKITTGKYDANHATYDGQYNFFTCAIKPLKCDTYILDEEVLLLPGNGANVGQVFYFKGKFDAYQRTYILSDIKISAKFLYYKMLSNWENVNKEKQYGTATNYIKLGNFLDYTLPIPPLNEQKRIAQKLDELFATVESIKTRLDNAPTTIKRFRQSILAAATSGKLTAEWRMINTDLENPRITVEKAEAKKKNKVKVRKPKNLEGVLDLIDIPETWEVIENHRLAKDGNTAICAGPFGTIFKAKDFRDEGIPIIFLRHVGEAEYLTRKPGFMDVDVWKEKHQSYSVYGGELVVSKLGDPPGTACIYPTDIGTAMVTPDVMKMNVDNTLVPTKYLMYFFNSPTCKNMIRELAFGVTRLRIDLTMFKNFPIPLPPTEEQKEIVSQVESLFTLADTLEEKIESAKKRVDKLTQSILTKAFRGELVEQDPNDESAEKLLERIKSEQVKEQPKKTRKKK